ncbi:MAG: O-antigen ligase family protein [Chitinophagales bacterium]
MQWLAAIPHQRLGFLACMSMLYGMVMYDSYAFLSIGTIVLAANSVFNLKWKDNIQTLWQDKGLLAVTLIFLLYLFSGFFSENLEFWLHKMRAKVPLLVLPLGFAALHFSKRKYAHLLYFFYLLVLATCFVILGMYLVNFEAYTLRYKQGLVLPTPIHHIRFSLLVAYSVGIAIYLWQEKYTFKFSWETHLLWIGGVLLFLFQHILAVRTGLISLYIVLIYFGLRYIISSKNYKLGMALGIGSLLFVIAAFSYVPTLKNKMGYTIYNLKKYWYHQHDEQINNYSDGKRMVSIMAGLAIGNQHPVMGVGVGDLPDALNDFYCKNHQTFCNQKLSPHNQYVYTYAAMGWIGLLGLLIGVLTPFFYQKRFKIPLLAIISLLHLFAFLVEYPLETQIGIAFYLFFLLLPMRVINVKD